MLPVFYTLGATVYEVYYHAFEKRGQEALRGLAFFFGILFITEVGLILVFGVDYRYAEAGYIGPALRFAFVDLPYRMLIPCVISLLMLVVLQLYLSRTLSDAQSRRCRRTRRARADGRRSDQDQAHRVRHRSRPAIAGPSSSSFSRRAFGRTRIYRAVLRSACSAAWQPARHRDRRDAARRGGEHHGDVLCPHGRRPSRSVFCSHSRSGPGLLDDRTGSCDHASSY
jgi:hypothetical protein